MTTIDTTKADRRELHFESLDDLLAEVDRIVAAERAGTLCTAGNWTAGQVLGHVAAWIEYGYAGYPEEMCPPWFIRVIVRLMLRFFMKKPMRPGYRIPKVAEGTFGTKVMSVEEGAMRLRSAVAKLQRCDPPQFHSPALGPLTNEQRIALNLRHAELHLSFLWPEDS